MSSTGLKSPQNLNLELLAAHSAAHFSHRRLGSFACGACFCREGNSCTGSFKAPCPASHALHACTRAAVCCLTALAPQCRAFDPFRGGQALVVHAKPISGVRFICTGRGLFDELWRLDLPARLLVHTTMVAPLLNSTLHANQIFARGMRQNTPMLLVEPHGGLPLTATNQLPGKRVTARRSRGALLLKVFGSGF
jgi:hypothetical protein